MATFEEMREKYYTTAGKESLINRLKTIYTVWQQTAEDKYPLQLQMFGFPPLVLKSKIEAEGHVNELTQILMVTIHEDKKEGEQE